MTGDRRKAQGATEAAGKRPLGNRLAFRSILLGLILVASVGMVVFLAKSPPQLQQTVPSELQAVLRPAPKVLQDFKLVGHDGRPFTLDHLRSKWSMLFFGYTYCPDICPTTLAVLSAVFQRLEQHPGFISDTQVVFVSVDPQRDRPERLAEYVAYFDERFTAATGDVENIDGLVRQIGAGYQIEPEDSPGNYLISHTSSIFLVDPQARLVGAFSFPHNAETIASQYLKVREL